MSIEVTPAHYTDMAGVKAVDTSIVIFHDVVRPDGKASKEHGRPMFKTVVYCNKITPGDKLFNHDQPATEQDKRDHPLAWERYEKKQTQQISGTPLEAWPILTTIQVHELKALNIFTVEQLADLPDQFAQRIMGYNMLRSKAKAFIDAAKSTVSADQMREQLAQRDKTIAEMQRQLAGLAANQRKKPGPRKKNGADSP